MDFKFFASVHQYLLDSSVVTEANSWKEVMDSVVVKTKISKQGLGEVDLYRPISRRMKLGFSPVFTGIALIYVASQMFSVVIHQSTSEIINSNSSTVDVT